MAYEGSRLSTLSNNSHASRANPSPSAQVSTQTLLNALHTSYSQSKPFFLESSTSLVVNTWLNTARQGPDGSAGGTVDADLANRAWQHATRRAEDQTIILGSLHESAPSLLVPFIDALPVTVPPILYTALAAVRPFLTCATPQNPSTARHSCLAATFTFSLAGNLNAASLKLSSSGVDTSAGLLNLPAQQGFRAFDVFYYLLSSASSATEREALGLRTASAYSLLKKSGTYDPPSYLPTADDAAAAEEWRECLKAIGITGPTRRNLISVLVALLKLGDSLGYLLDEEELDNICEDAAGLLDVDPEVLIRRCTTDDRQTLIAGLYECIVDWVILKANQAIQKDVRQQHKRASSSSRSSDAGAGAFTPTSSDDDSADITVLEIPNPQLGKAVALRTVFDDTEGINAEMKQDGVQIAPAGHSVLTEMQAAIAQNEPDLGIMSGPAGRERELQRDRRDAVLERILHESEEDAFLKTVLPDGKRASPRFDLMALIGSSRAWFQLCVHPTDESPAAMATSSAPWSAGSPSRQLRAWRLPEWANRRNKQLDYTADFDHDEFHSRYAPLGCREGSDGIESFALERGWSNGELTIGTERVWIREGSWWEAESMLDMLNSEQPADPIAESGFPLQHAGGSGFFGSPFGDNMQDSRTNLLRNQSSATLDNHSIMGTQSIAPTAMTSRNVSGGDYGLGGKGDEVKGAAAFAAQLDPELQDPRHLEQKTQSRTRRLWVAFVWAVTWWIPSFLLYGFGRMKRPDIRMAWREKIVLVSLIFLLNATIVFYITTFGNLLCPNLNKAWNNDQVSEHQGDNDFYVSVAGNVYDITKFWRLQHSNIQGVQVESSQMQTLAGQNLDPLFPLPLTVACPGLVSDQNFALRYNASNYPNLQVAVPYQHVSGSQTSYNGSALANNNWYSQTFLPYMKQFYKGNLVYDTKALSQQGTQQQYPAVIINNNVYDLSNYFYTTNQLEGYTVANFLPEDVTNMIQSNPGQDITSQWNSYVAKNATGAALASTCLNNAFYVGITDFRNTPRCQVNNYILLAFTIILCTVILSKFLGALQLGSKKRPSQQDKFVICQVPAYTEGEDHLRKGLDSLTALQYDNKRKLICVICDGMIVGGGNDRPTPKIVLDILGVDPKIDPPALPFKSVGAGSAQLNYGKVYSGLYEYEGNVVPYLVVVKVGKESEQAKPKPGNRGKRDSQIMLMSFLNRVHHRAPMSPLELEMFHQINNIIGVDPELYEYLFMVDADTLVREDSLNRLVAACAHDAKIAGICGETSLENEERSWWTMIQVYEYYISHHLAKAFESLFGSVTCLPGCFCMYRLRTADKGKPLIISDKVISEYAIQEVDTLHKKNLLSLGEDRYLTTLMTKHFPFMSYKFVPDAFAQTAAPETWGVLLSQRRRWINSTIHNLAELVLLKDLCGFCCFSMRFVVFIDLFGTLILPATCCYLAYLIYKVATHQGQFPLLSIIIIAAVYGLQAIIFIIKRQWQHVGWMLIYILAYPIYSFVLPIYSFWKQDDFSWGTTRIVVEEKGAKKVISTDDEGFDPRSIPLQSWDDYAAVNNLPGGRGAFGNGSEKADGAYDEYEMDDMRSVYSHAKPASTILTGFKSQPNFYMPPQSPAFGGSIRPQMPQHNSHYSNVSRYTDNPSPMREQSVYGMHTNTMSEHGFPTQPSPYMSRSPAYQSTDNLMAASPMMSPMPQQSPMGMPMNRAGRRSPMGFPQSRPASTVNFTQSITGTSEPTDAMIIEAIQNCLLAVDLDNVTKKQLKALTEQRLQTQLSLERKAFLDSQIDNELANM